MVLDSKRADEELRLAVVMSGGVSLAVWMGGVALEIDRLRRASLEVFLPAEGVRDESQDLLAYRQLLELTGSVVRVDVISGTSAGGLNGALLGAAVAYDRPLDPLKAVWLDKGGFQQLFRSPRDPNPPSLLQGDEYFLKEICAVLKEIRDDRAVSETAPPTLRLFMTASLLEGEPRSFRDRFGAEIPEVTHRGLFRFGLDDLQAVDAVRRLALAARSSASHPGGFEASRVPRGPADVDELHPDMGDIPDWRKSRYVVDGGVLLNRPLAPAVDAIFEQPPAEDVRRVVLLVVPNPGGEGEGQRERVARNEGLPLLRETLGSVVRLPAAQSLVEELEELKRHNRRVQVQREARRRLTSSPEVDLFGAARSMFLGYLQTRAERQARSRVGRLEPERAGDLQSAPKVSDPLVSALAQAILRRMPLVPPGPDTEPVLRDPWVWGMRPIEQSAGLVMDDLRDAIHVAPPRDGGVEGAEELRSELSSLRLRAHEVLQRARLFGAWERRYWEHLRGDRDHGPPADPRADFGTTSAWCERALEGWASELRRLDAEEPPPWRDGPSVTGDPAAELATIIGLIRVAARPLVEAVATWVLQAYDAFRRAPEGFFGEDRTARFSPTEADAVICQRLAPVTSPGDDAPASSEPPEGGGQAPGPAPATPPLGEVRSVVTPPPGVSPGDGEAVLPPRAGTSRGPETAAPGSPAVLVRSSAGFVPSVRSLEGLREGEDRQVAVIGTMVDLALAEAAAVDVVQITALPPETVTEQEIHLIQLSAATPNAFDGRATASKKLTGLQLMHFGAFYRASWRANDWLWGRLDGVMQLVQTILDPSRLARLGLTTAETVSRIKEIATGSGEDEATRKFLCKDEARRAQEASHELAFLDASAAPPRSIPRTVEWVARRFQLDILRRELPQLAYVLAADVDLGARETYASRLFLRRAFAAMGLQPPRRAPREVPAGLDLLEPEDAVRVFEACKVGQERLEGEVGSDLFSETASTATAVAVAATSGNRGGLGPVGGMLASVRGLSLSFWFFVRAALSRGRVAFGLLTVVAMAAAVIAAMVLAGRVEPGALRWVVVGILAAAVVLAAIRSFARFPILAFLLFFLALLAGILALMAEPGVTVATIVLSLVGTAGLLVLIGHGQRFALARPYRFGLGVAMALTGLVVFLLVPFVPDDRDRCAPPIVEAAREGIGAPGRTPESSDEGAGAPAEASEPADDGRTDARGRLCAAWARDWAGRGIVLGGSMLAGGLLMAWGRRPRRS